MNATTKIRYLTDYTVAAEIEAIAWKLLEGDIETGSDAMQLAADYADIATETYEDDAGVDFGATAQNIVRLVRQSLTARIKMEISNRDFMFEVEFATRQRAGRIDANGCGDIPVW